jgi:hypothetical protein
MEITDQFCKGIINEVFGPCTVVGECMTPAELREDIEQYFQGESSRDLYGWFAMRITVELMDAFPENRYDWTNGPTAAQAKQDRAKRKELERGLKSRWWKFFHPEDK